MTDPVIYEYVPHHRTMTKPEGGGGPIKTAERLPSGDATARFDRWLALKVTSGVGTMWCAYAFAAPALVSLPAAAADRRSEATYDDADAVRHEAVKLQEHLLAQDAVLEELVEKLTGVEAASGGVQDTGS